MNTSKKALVQISKAAALALIFSAALLAQNYPGKWVGKWIWIAGQPRPVNYFLFVRHTFALNDAPQRARLSITAANRYVLYVNGKYIGRGPARSGQFWKSYDRYELADSLHAGNNTIAVLAYYYGTANNYSTDERAGLFAQFNIMTPGTEQVVFGTDQSWRVSRAHAWSENVIRVGFQEIYDANAELTGWMMPGFNDSKWENAVVIAPQETPFSYLEARQTPMMKEREVSPTRIVEAGEVLELAERFGATPM